MSQRVKQRLYRKERRDEKQRGPDEEHTEVPERENRQK